MFTLGFVRARQLRSINVEQKQFLPIETKFSGANKIDECYLRA